ncbi:MAG: NUDIX domain-containing protein [Patescibacteria group bacterium]|nr:NUDIX domain-containing protein [Patescibacteria group bacterium]
MRTVTVLEINEKRNLGFRPEVVGCFLHNKKIFLFYDKKYDLWQFPQGGVRNLEEIKNALLREMTEELGNTLYSQVKNEEFFAEDKIHFPKKYWGNRTLKNDSGREVMMKGKYYYAFAIQINTKDVTIEETEFDGYILASFDQARILLQKIRQHEKRRVSMRFLKILTEKKLIV